MNTKSKSPQSEAITTQYKDTTLSLKKQVLSALKSGTHTAIELNRMFFFNDSRKVISDLRKEGYLINDYILRGKQKAYFLKSDNQTSLNFGGTEL